MDCFPEERLVRSQRRADVHDVYTLIQANQAELPVQAMCKTLRVSTSGYYAWHDRVPSARAVANVTLVGQIREVFDASDQTYGMPRVRAALADEGAAVSRKRVARLMRHGAMHGVSRRRGYVRMN